MGKEITCTHCGSQTLEEGFIDDAAQGQVAWLQGPREVGFFGNPKRSGPRAPVLAYRCPRCSHLELFAGQLG